MDIWIQSLNKVRPTPFTRSIDYTKMGQYIVYQEDGLVSKNKYGNLITMRSLGGTESKMLKLLEFIVSE